MGRKLVDGKKGWRGVSERVLTGDWMKREER